MSQITVGIAIVAAVLAIGAALLKYKYTGRLDWLAIFGGVLVVILALAAAQRVNKGGS
jgi:hypothetical protein